MDKQGRATTLWLSLALAMLMAVGLVLGAPTQNHSVSLSVGNSLPTVLDISGIPNVDMTEAGEVTVSFSVLVDDQDGVNALPTFLENANFTRNSEAVRSDSACGRVSDLNATTVNYSCAITFLYFDDAGEWNVTVGVVDNASEGDSSTETFTVNELNAFVLVSGSDSFSFGQVFAGSTNILATDDPLTLNNTGNSDPTSVDEEGFDLHGLTDSSSLFGTGNFSMNPSDACEGTSLVNATFVTIGSATLTRGAVAIEDLFGCLESTPAVDQISQQQYQTNVTGNSWVTRITA